MVQPSSVPSVVSKLALAVALAASLGGVANAQTATEAQQAAPTSADPAPAPIPGGQGASSDNQSANGQFLNDIVVTAAPRGKSKMQSSVSVTDVAPATIANLAPRSEAEVLHLIPGIRVESTAGGGGNSNITVRGLPLAAGGAKYVQLQEDGLPNVEFGDIAFGNNDFWQRYDYTVERVQAIRGGSASTFASQAPGAVINYVSKTGETAGGKVGITSGLGYSQQRLDFDYGGPLNETLRFNVGGFYRRGNSERHIPYKAYEGYQVKANVTKTFDNDDSYVRVLFKRLDDRAPTYTAGPFGVKLKGNKITGYYALPGFDAREDSNFSIYNRTFPTVGTDGRVKTGVNSGIDVKSTTAGLNLHKWLGDVLSFDDRFAYTWQNGTFSAPFYGSLTSVTALTTGAGAYRTTVGGVTYVAARALYGNGPNAGQAVPGATVVNQNPNLYTDMTNMNHWANDAGLTGKFDVASGKLTARAGFYHYRQNIAMDWHWNSSLNAGGSDNPARIDLYTAAGVRLTDNGLTGYNNQWGGFDRRYDLQYTGNAPYLSGNYADDHLDLDASVRFESLHGGGTFNPTAATPTSLDVNGDGALSIAERQVYLTNYAGAQKLDYTVHYTSWSGGANYRFSPDTSLFIRASRGYRANADRIVSDFAGAFTAQGKLTTIGKAVAVNPVTQQELGLKQRGYVAGGNFGLFLTGFRSQAVEYNYDLTQQRQTFQKYHTYGTELEAQYSIGAFSLNANLVYTHSRIAEDLISGNKGKTPRATPNWMYTIAPTYDFGMGAVGVTLVGQSSSYPQDDNILKQQGENVVSAFVRLGPWRGADLTLNANNLFNTWAQAGRLDQGTVADLAGTGTLFGVPYAATNRATLGRTFSATLAYRF